MAGGGPFNLTTLLTLIDCYQGTFLRPLFNMVR